MSAAKPPYPGYFSRRDPPRRVDYEEAYWGEIVDPDGRRRCRSEERGRYLLEVAQELAFLNGIEKGRVLDVGCGLGFFLSGLDGGWKKHGVEISAYAARRAAEWGEIHLGDLASAAYPGGFFDAVVVHHVVEHVRDPVALIREIRRVLRDGGVLLLGTPDFDSGCARRFGPRYRLLQDPTHVSLFTNESMHRFLRDHGFVIERVEYPFFETPHFTAENLMRLFDTEGVSPPFYGNVMTFYCRKPSSGRFCEGLRELGQLAGRVADTLGPAIDAAGRLVAGSLGSGGRVITHGEGGGLALARLFAADLATRLGTDGRSQVCVWVAGDPAAMTGGKNGCGDADLCERRMDVPGRRGDVAVIVCPDGPSQAVAHKVRRARALGLSVTVIAGEGGEPGVDCCEHYLRVPCVDPARVRELALALLHSLCDAVVTHGSVERGAGSLAIARARG